ncbi:MAG TPA: hypothetical protein VK149_02145 [Sideroxyarcus sp.]|nr:hypothetical protein [Sideroxyarcus sp.]
MANRFAALFGSMACAVLGAGLLSPLHACGQEQDGQPAQESLPPLLAPVENAMNALDAPRDYLSGKFVDFVRNVDSFFGDDRNYQETNDSVLQIDISRVVGYGGERKFVVAGRAKLHLPVAEKSLHLLLETDPDKNATVNPTQSQTPIKKTDAPESYAAALRYEKAGAERWHFSADGGLQFAGLSSSPFARTRASLAMPLDDAWRMKLAESVFWFNTIGAGESTQLDIERPISEPALFRATSSATWLNDKQNFDLRQDFSIFHTLSERTALLYQASAIGVSRPQTQVTDYVLLLSYRYRLHQDWMFFDLSPQLHFPKERGFRSSGVLSMRLEMLFGGTK